MCVRNVRVVSQHLRTPQLVRLGRWTLHREIVLTCIVNVARDICLRTYVLTYLLTYDREYREYKAKEKEGTLSAEGQDLMGAFRKATEEDRTEREP